MKFKNVANYYLNTELDLFIQDGEFGDYAKMTGIDNDSLGLDVTVIYKDGQRDYFSFDQVKPIFFSLDHLTKPIVHDGEEFIPMKELQKLYPHKMIYVNGIDYVPQSDQWMLNTMRNGEVAINIMRRIDEKLLKWHFNLFNLPSTEYIDKSTISIVPKLSY